MTAIRLVLALLLSSLIGYGAATETASQQAVEHFQYFAPNGAAQKMELRVSGKLREYFVLDTATPIELTIKGPAKLKLLSRAILSAPNDTLDYSYVVERKGASKPLTVKHSTFRSEKSAFAGPMEGAVAESRARTIDVPGGEQTYTLSLPKTARNRLLFRFGTDTESFDGTTIVAMTPSEFTTQVDLTTREETLSYYRVGIGNRVVLNLVGPATLKVLARIEFDPTMSQTQKWKVAVSEDGVAKSTYNLSAKPSDITVYKVAASLIPSAAEVFYVDVPTGSHRYEFALPDDQRSGLLRFLLPRRHLERE
jgi:hypothetical protein